ncbi:putative calcium-binding protein, partial [Xenococcus sp. PCC 7305]|uniref:lectin-like protein n=1 Tax=Xenococcus sp. PCC 7305 TaxID=102125 RepID=UPI0002ACE14D
AAHNGTNNSSWQELYEWWAAHNGTNNSSWQELSEEELVEFHQEVTGENKVWWEEVFCASQDDGNVEDIELPGENNNLLVGATYYKEIYGGSNDDIIAGDISDDNITAGQGDDLIDGAQGDDTIFGADGYDTIFGFDGRDSIMGGNGDDVISGESDNDVLIGEAGADVLMGGHNNDYLDGGDGRDFLNGNTGHDVLIGGAGDDALEGESGKDLLVGGEGQDLGNGGSGDDLIFGDQYSENLHQAFGNNLSSLTVLFDSGNAIDPSEDSTSTETNAEELINVALAQDAIRLEAESMNLSGGYYPDDDFYHGEVIRTSSDNPSGVAKNEFTGENGYYQVKVRYIDESDGNASLRVKIGDAEIDSWILEQNEEGENQYHTRTISQGMHIDTNAAIEIQGQAENYEFARVDYIEFIPIESPQDIDSDSESHTDLSPEDASFNNLSNELALGTNSDILKGGFGNDGIDGGKGNDIIFGEDELNDSRYIAPPWIDGAFHYGHSTYILSETGTWQEAQAEAQSYGGNLVTINDAAEQERLNENFGTSEKFWIGFTDHEQEGVWKWANGDKAIYTDWKPFQPNNFGGQDYAVINDDSFLLLGSKTQWNDVYSSEKNRGIIEIDWSSMGGNDTIFGGAGDDLVYGNSGNDLIYGDNAEIEILTEVNSGNDNLTGNGGHDTINGGVGNDTINGTDEVVVGYLERDFLHGGAGADKFVLGDETQVYYGIGGNQDYAVIQDFDPNIDILNIYGTLDDYEREQIGNDTYLSHNGDLIAILENTSSSDSVNWVN